MNKIADGKYQALCNLLKPVGSRGMSNVGKTPWSMEKTRTFACKCGTSRVIPEDALQLHEDEKGAAVVNIRLGDNMRCETCGQTNYEMMCFAHRYGLMRPEPRKAKKKMKEPTLDFGDEFIVCKRKEA